MENKDKYYINRFKNVSTKTLMRRMEKAPDFGYDDEAYELTRRLRTKGEKWTWSKDDRIIIKKKMI